MSAETKIKGQPRLWHLGDGQAPRGAHVAVVPGELAPLLPLDLPQVLKGAAREQVARRHVAEALSQPDTELELRPFPQAQKGWTKMIVVEAGLAQAWRKTLGKGCRAAVPDYLTLPTAPGLWTVQAQGDRVLFRTGQGDGQTDGGTAETDLVIAQLSRIDPPPRAILRLGDPQPALDAVLRDTGAAIETTIAGLRRHSIRPATWSDTTGGVDFLRGPRAAQDRIAEQIRRWRPIVLAGACAAAAWAGAIYLETRNLTAQASADRARVETMVREHFLPSGPILDVRTQVTRVLETVEAPEIEVTSALTPLVQFQYAAPLLTAPDVVVQTASYAGATGLEVTVKTKDFNELDAVVLALQDADFLVEQLSAQAQQSGGVIAQLRLELFE